MMSTPTAEPPTAAPPQLLHREQLSQGDRIDLFLCRGCAATPGLTYWLVPSTTTRPARAGRAYYLYSHENPNAYITTVRAHSVGVAVIKANDYLRGVK